MKSFRFLAAGAALFLLASCGKEYNSIPGGNKGDNPLLPLGTADAGQIRYLLNGDKIRIYNAYRGDTLIGNTLQRRVVGLYTDPDGNMQSFGLYLLRNDTVTMSYSGKDSIGRASIGIAVGFQDATDVDGSNTRIYTSYLGMNKSDFQVDFSQMDATTLRGTFYARLSRWPIDSNDIIEVKNGTFWVQK